MILRRLAHAFRKQDWATVIVEFVIVVSGIFLGLQANEWAQERENRQQEKAALERFFQESENTLVDIEEFLKVTRRINQIRRSAVQFTDSDRAEPADDLMLGIGINTLNHFPPFTPVAVAYEEMVAAGGTTRIQKHQTSSCPTTGGRRCVKTKSS